MTFQARRKLLKSVTAGGSVLIIGKSLPESWTKPVIDVALLPAHAQMSTCADLVNSTPSSLSVESLSNAAGNDLDGIQITFNGCEELTMFAADDPDTNADLIAFIDADSAQPNVFDVEDGPATNWNLIAHSFTSIPITNQAEGTHTIRAERLSGVTAGTTYDIIFDVFVPAITGGTEMTISDLRAVVI